MRFVLWTTTKHCEGVEGNGSLFLQSGCLSEKRLNSVVGERQYVTSKEKQGRPMN